MPELPEVETVRRGLEPVMQGAVIERAEINRPDLRWPFPPKMKERLEGQKILRLRRRSKYIMVDLGSAETLLIHLGMSGRMLISKEVLGAMTFEHPQREKHDHVVFHMNNGAQIVFNDPRRFGAMDLYPTQDEETQALIKKLGPEPFSNAFNETYLAEQLARKTSKIKTALLDQSVVSGLGNIYVCEVLYRSKLNPNTRACDVKKEAHSTLISNIRSVLDEAIQAGGSTLKDHRMTDGSLGYFQHQFSVYGREGEPCKTEGCTAAILREKHAGRSTFFCPNCQSA